MGDVEDVISYINSKAEDFDNLCVERHEAGAAEYGKVTFLENDVIRMMLEELADTTNYCRMQAIKLLILQERLEQEMTVKGMIKDDNVEVDIGFQAFKGTKDGWKQ